jgi:hypothetical protein
MRHPILTVEYVHGHSFTAGTFNHPIAIAWFHFQRVSSAAIILANGAKKA